MVNLDVGTALGWLIGSGLDEATLTALDEEDVAQKQLMADALGS